MIEPQICDWIWAIHKTVKNNGRNLGLRHGCPLFAMRARFGDMKMCVGGDRSARQSLNH